MSGGGCRLPRWPCGTVVYLRYPIAIVPYFMVENPDPYNHFDLAGYYHKMTFAMSFQKNDDAAILVAGLRRVTLATGEVTLLVALDSGSTPAGPAVQRVTRTITCDPCISVGSEYAYFVEVGVWKASATSDPKLVGLGVTLTP